MLSRNILNWVLCCSGLIKVSSSFVDSFMQQHYFLFLQHQSLMWHLPSMQVENWYLLLLLHSLPCQQLYLPQHVIGADIWSNPDMAYLWLRPGMSGYIGFELLVNTISLLLWFGTNLCLIHGITSLLLLPPLPFVILCTLILEHLINCLLPIKFLIYIVWDHPSLKSGIFVSPSCLLDY